MVKIKKKKKKQEKSCTCKKGRVQHDILRKKYTKNKKKTTESQKDKAEVDICERNKNVI